MIAAALSHAERFSVITDSGRESSDVKDADKQDVSVGDKVDTSSKFACLLVSID